jgi:hypothetical protein
MEKKNSPHSGINWKRIFPFLDAALLVLLGWYVFTGLSRVPFHGDESTFIRMSMDFAYLFSDHAVAKVAYHPQPGYYSVEQYQRVLTGAINPLTIGLAWTIAGMDRADLNGFWIWYPQNSDEWTYNAAVGNLPDERLLDVARIPSTLFTALSIVAVFAAALALARSRPAAWIAAILYATTPGILVNGRRAMQEGGMLLFTALAVVCAWYVAREFLSGGLRWRRINLGYALLGAAGGLAVAGKHTSVLVLAPMYLALFLLLWSAGRGLDARASAIVRFHLAAGLLGSGLLSVAVFYLFDPVWWYYTGQWLLLLCLSTLCFLAAFPVSGRWIWGARSLPVVALAAATLAFPAGWTGIYQPARIIVNARNELMAVHEDLGWALPTAKSRVREMAVQLLTAKTQYYESFYWDDLEEEHVQIRAYEAAGLNGRGGGTAWGIVIFLLAAAGATAVVVRHRRWETLILFLWLALPAAALLITNPLAWQRYYIILIAPWSVLAGYAATLIPWPGLLDRLRRLRPVKM